MSLAKVTKQLKRELKANPTKAGALGVLTVVAAVFWGPLLFKSDEKTTKAGAVAAPAGVQVVGAHAGGASSAAAGTPTKAATVDWHVLARGMASDPRMQSKQASSDSQDQNPFRTKTAEEEDAEWFALIDELSREDTQSAPRVELTKPVEFEQYPLALTSTIVGNRFRRAVINGKSRSVGGEIAWLNGSSMVLAEVEPRFVVVKWNGKRREIKIPPPGERPAQATGLTAPAGTSASQATAAQSAAAQATAGSGSAASDAAGKPAEETTSAER